jgi:hypothetical protein
MCASMPPAVQILPSPAMTSVPGPITIRYSEAGETADDEIVRLVGATGGVRVVVSTDREVRDRSEKGGAIVLWSQALAAWAFSR